MVLSELILELQRIVKVHPEANDAQIWTYGTDTDHIRVGFVRFDKKHKPARLVLED